MILVSSFVPTQLNSNIENVSKLQVAAIMNKAEIRLIWT